MAPTHPVLIGLTPDDPAVVGLVDRVVDWVRHLGYEPTVTLDGRETLAWVRERDFVASLLDCGMTAETGERIWRTVRPIVGRRLVLMVREPRNDVWFEALRSGVGAVLPLPPEEPMVRAALRAATRAPVPGCWDTGRRETGWRS